MINLELKEKKQDIIDVATELFEKFTKMPKDIRSDDKERTGIQVVVWEPGTRNLVTASIGKPSEVAKFLAVEKAVRSLNKGDVSSENSADADLMQFAGAVSIVSGRHILTASVSGLKSEDDVAISIAILAKLSHMSFIEVCENIEFYGGFLPIYLYSEVEDRGYFDFLF